MEYYNILGLNCNASQEEIRSAYKRLAVKYHPDKNNEPGAEEKFKKISEAYQYLNSNSNSNISDKNINRVSAEELFNQFFKMNIGEYNENVNKFSFNNMNIDIDTILSNLSSNTTSSSSTRHNYVGNNIISRQSNITIQNGKKIEHIIETRNGNRIERKIITDI